MIALWMLYALVVAFCLGVAALLTERVVRTRGKGTRLVWASAMVLSVALPVMAVQRAMSQDARTSTVVDAVRVDPAKWLAFIDRTLLMGWLGSALLLAVMLLLAQRSLLRRRRAWQRAEFHGEAVLISSDLGPGVVVTPGLAQIVVPTWALDLKTELQQLMLLHEREHLRARDHWLIVMGLLLLVLCPFNPILWWQFTRLKLAIEMDCDARVLSGRRDVRAYAALLLDVGVRMRAGHLVFAAFAAPPHAIERRIRMMLDTKQRPRRWLMAACTAGAVVLGFLACNTPEPASPEAAVRSALGEVPEASSVVAKKIYNDKTANVAELREVESAVGKLYAVNYEVEPGSLKAEYDETCRTPVGSSADKMEECEISLEIRELVRQVDKVLRRQDGGV
jgi:beta-lactamase regulating signal transducer with metallopeptidase domain